jgi:hypothetical protein
MAVVPSTVPAGLVGTTKGDTRTLWTHGRNFAPPLMTEANSPQPLLLLA